MIVTISGKMYSGAEALGESLAQQGPPGTTYFTTTALVRDEAQKALDALNEPIRDADDLHTVAMAADLTLAQAQEFLDIIVLARHTPGFAFTKSHNAAVRRVILHLRNDWRSQRYWTDRAVQHALAEQREGKTVIFGGLRLREEHDAFRRAGARMIRLEVSPDAQKTRATVRDGRTLTSAEMNHPTETALDEFDFDLRLDTDMMTATQVTNAARSWMKEQMNR